MMSSVHEYGVVPGERTLSVILGYLLSLKQCFLTVLQAVSQGLQYLWPLFTWAYLLLSTGY